MVRSWVHWLPQIGVKLIYPFITVIAVSLQKVIQPQVIVEVVLLVVVDDGAIAERSPLSRDRGQCRTEPAHHG